MGNKVVYQVSQGNGEVQQFTDLRALIEHVSMPVSRKDILKGKHRGITLYEVNKDGSPIMDTFGGLPWADRKYREQYINLGIEIPGITDTEDEDTEESDSTTELTDLNDDVPSEDTDEDELADEDTSDEPPVAVTRSVRPVAKSPLASGKPNRTGIPVAVAKVNAKPVLDDPEYPEIGTFDTEKDMKKYVKKLTDSQLMEWAELEGVEWKASDNQSINRMRIAMALKAKHGFGAVQGTGTSKKSKSKYADYSTEKLVEMALEADLDIKDAKGDIRIMRMYTIMALREAGILD